MSALAPAFGDAIHGPQRVFRTVMNAMARPGTVHRLDVEAGAPAPMSVGAAALALALLDYETPVWIDHSFSASPGIASWLRFHTGASIVSDPSQAALAFCADASALPPLGSFALGTAEYPDRSTTLVIGVASLGGGVPLHLAGPGIRGTQVLNVPAEFAELAPAFQRNHSLFPCGVDVVLVHDRSIAALPRTTRIRMVREG